jgi:hypothetical protein
MISAKSIVLSSASLEVAEQREQAAACGDRDLANERRGVVRRDSGLVVDAHVWSPVPALRRP